MACQRLKLDAWLDLRSFTDSLTPLRDTILSRHLRTGGHQHQLLSPWPMDRMVSSVQRQVSEDLGYRKKGDIGDKCILFRETTTYGNDVSSVNLLFTEVAEMIV